MSVFLYDVKRTYAENCDQGPLFNGTFPERRLKPERYDFLGVAVRSRVGIPAGPLLNSKWTQLAFNSGADIAYYKTIRAEETPVNGYPNVCYLETDAQFDPLNPPASLQSRETLPEDRSKIAITNSFGMPSRGPDYLKEDIAKANGQASEGQVLIVSVVGKTKESFIQAARLAKECGAKIIEANFSCPNVKSKEGQLYLDPANVAEMSQALVEEIGQIPLIIKVGAFKDKALLEKVLVAAAGAGVRAVSGINTVAVDVYDAHGKAALGDRLKSGVCGFPIQATALKFARDAREIINRLGLKLTLIAGGGITKPEDFKDFLEVADFATCGAGWFNDVEIFDKFHKLGKDV